MTPEQELKALQNTVAGLRHAYHIGVDRLAVGEAEYAMTDLERDARGERGTEYGDMEIVRLRRDTKHTNNLIHAAIVGIELLIHAKEKDIADRKYGESLDRLPN